MSKYKDLRQSPPNLDVNQSSDEVIFTTISCMCDNKHTIRFSKFNDKFKMSGMGFSLSNWQFKHEVYEMEWEADLGNWDKVISMINTSTEVIQKVASRSIKNNKKKVIELLSEIVEQGTDLSWQTAEKAEMLLKELNQNKDE